MCVLSVLICVSLSLPLCLFAFINYVRFLRKRQLIHSARDNQFSWPLCKQSSAGTNGLLSSADALENITRDFENIIGDCVLVRVAIFIQGKFAEQACLFFPHQSLCAILQLQGFTPGKCYIQMWHFNVTPACWGVWVCVCMTLVVGWSDD